MTGRSHDSSYTLFRISQSSSEGFKEFTETGRSDTLDAQSQGEGGIFDEFNAPPVTAGEGKTEAEFFVDSNHSRVKFDNFFPHSISFHFIVNIVLIFHVHAGISCISNCSFAGLVRRARQFQFVHRWPMG